MVNQNTQLQQQEQQTALDTSKVLNNLVRIVGSSLVLMGYTGDHYIPEAMAKKITELFGPVDPDLMQQIMNEFMTGEREPKGYQMTIVDLSLALKDHGVKTLIQLHQEDLKRKETEHLYR